jgi:hypothetical protein
MNKTLGSLVLAAGLLGQKADATVYTLPSAVQGTAINSTNVIGAGSSGATSVNLLTSTQTALGGGLTGTIDAGQYNDASTMYLGNSGSLNIIRNSDGFNLGSYNVGLDTFGVSGAINVGGVNYAILGGTTSGIRALNLQTGALTPLAGSYTLTSAQGLDAFMRPGGTTLDDLAIGIERQITQSQSTLDIYGDQGLLSSFNPGTINGIPLDVSFNLVNADVWFGSSQGKLYNKPFDYSQFAIPVSITNQPSGKFTTEGGSAEFKVGAKGGYLRFQWWKNGIVIPDATNDVYLVSNAQASDFGTYQVVVTNSVNVVPSTVVRLDKLVSPALVNPRRDASGFSFQFAPQETVNYTVQASDSLWPADWQTQTNVTANATNPIVVSDGSTNVTRFYRVEATPLP